MQDMISQQEPSELVKANPLLMLQLQNGRINLAEAERRATGPERLKEAFSSIPWHAERAANNPNYWKELYSSCGNW